MVNRLDIFTSHLVNRDLSLRVASFFPVLSGSPVQRLYLDLGSRSISLYTYSSAFLVLFTLFLKFVLAGSSVLSKYLNLIPTPFPKSYFSQYTFIHTCMHMV